MSKIVLVTRTVTWCLQLKTKWPPYHCMRGPIIVAKRYNQSLLKMNRYICACRDKFESSEEFIPMEQFVCFSIFYLIIVCLAHLKGSFNNVKSEIHGPTCYQCLWYGVILKPYKSASKSKNLWVTGFTILVFPNRL